MFNIPLQTCAVYNFSHKIRLKYVKWHVCKHAYQNYQKHNNIQYYIIMSTKFSYCCEVHIVLIYIISTCHNNNLMFIYRPHYWLGIRRFCLSPAPPVGWHIWNFESMFWFRNLVCFHQDEHSYLWRAGVGSHSLPDSELHYFNRRRSYPPVCKGIHILVTTVSDHTNKRNMELQNPFYSTMYLL